MRKFLSLVLVGLVFAGTMVACSSDDSDSGDTTETTADAGGDASSNPAVDEYCEQAEELGQQLEDARDNPEGADATEITRQASALAASAAELTSANPDDADRINECSDLMSVTP